jgi:hypothetical protein
MFKIPIADADNLIAQSKSQAGQDLFVVAMLQGKKNGTFLEIGGADPVTGNNTWLLERFFNFTGDSIEIGHFLQFYNAVKADTWPTDPSFDDLPNWIQQELKDRGYNPVPLDLIGLWADNRPNTNFHICDALNFNYDNLNSHYDYLQIDIEPPMANLSILEKLIPTHEFSVITFEHDIWRMTDEVRFVQKKSREFLSSHNYTLLVDDVTIQPVKGAGIDDNPIFFEDWYVNKKFINQDIIDAYKFISPGTIKYYPDILFNSNILKK